MTNNKRVRLHSSKYRNLGLVGQGQFGRVFCGVDRQTGELVAIKELDLRFPTKKFLRELRFLVTLHHPNIVTCQGLEHHQHGRYLVMDYCEGGTLRDLIEASGELSIVGKLKLISDILQGIDHAHSQNIIHRDLKPENILLNLESTFWNASISDFGVARLTEEMELGPSNSLGDTGSPAYMAPEQFYGKYSYASDLYAIGIILFELLLGERPFSGTPNELMLAHLNKPVEIPITVPFLLRSTLTTALQKLPQRRFASAAEMLKSITIAAEVLNVIDKSPLLLTQRKTASTAKIIAEKSLLAPSELMAVIAEDIYLGMGKNICCYNKKLVQQWQVELKEEVVQLNPHPSGCFAQTDTSLYWLGGAVIFQLVQRNKLVSTIAPGGSWLAFAAQAGESQVSFGIIKLPKLQQINQEIKYPFPPQLIALDIRHGLAIFPTESGTRLQLFNRRGGWFERFLLPIHLQLLTPSWFSPFSLLAVERQQNLGLLIDLKPFRVTRFPLEITPSFVVAHELGYLLAAREGTVLLLNQKGQFLGLWEVGREIRAIASLPHNKILVATCLDNQSILTKIELNFSSSLTPSLTPE